MANWGLIQNSTSSFSGEVMILIVILSLRAPHQTMTLSWMNCQMVATIALSLFRMSVVCVKCYECHLIVTIGFQGRKTIVIIHHRGILLFFLEYFTIRWLFSPQPLLKEIAKSLGVSFSQLTTNAQSFWSFAIKWPKFRSF